jgi:hypothetical protein
MSITLNQQGQMQIAVVLQLFNRSPTIECIAI